MPRVVWYKVHYCASHINAKYSNGIRLMYLFPDSRNGYWRHWSSAEQISELDFKYQNDCGHFG